MLLSKKQLLYDMLIFWFVERFIVWLDLSTNLIIFFFVTYGWIVVLSEWRTSNFYYIKDVFN